MTESKIIRKLIDLLLEEEMITAEEKNRMVAILERGEV